MADRFDQLEHQFAALRPIGVAVGGDHALVDPPGHLDLGVLVDGKQGVQTLVLLVGEQVGAGVQGPPGSVERVILTVSVPVDGVLDPPTATVQGIAGQTHDVEG